MIKNIQETYWEKRQRLAAEAVARLDLEGIRKKAELLQIGESYLHDIPVKSFFDPSGKTPEKNGVLDGLVSATENEVNSAGKNYTVAGGTYGGIERGVILVRKESEIRIR